MIASKPFRIASITFGILLLLFTFYLGYGAYTAKEYSKFFIVLIMFSISLTFIHLGTRGKEEAWKLGRKLIGIGIGLIVVAVLFNYTSSSNINIKDEITNVMIDAAADAAAQDVKNQLSEQNLNFPQDKDTLRRDCQLQTQEADETSFSMKDVCDEFSMAESSNISVNQIVEKAMERKTREIAKKQITGQIGNNKSFNDNFEVLSKSKNYVVIFGVIGVILFVLGFVFMYYSREEGKAINDVIYAGSLSATISCAINAAIFKLVDFLIKDQLVQGRLVGNKIIQAVMPELATPGIQQEMTKNMLMKVGEVIYGWLGLALNKAFMFSIVLFAVFLVLTAIFFLILKKKINS
jgi:hypothetical protein